METGEFLSIVAIIVGTCFIVSKILKLIKWKMEYEASVKKDMDALDEFIHNDDLEK